MRYEKGGKKHGKRRQENEKRKDFQRIVWQQKTAKKERECEKKGEIIELSYKPLDNLNPYDICFK
jgi:hypothetical protein